MAKCSKILFFGCLFLPGLLLGTYAQWRIKANVTKYSQVSTKDGITGAEVARRLPDSSGLQDVKIEATPGMLTDHYDPRSRILRLSQDVYFTPSVAAAGIAAHEAGHAVQDAEDYLPMEARTYIMPVVQLASRIAPWLFVAGLMLQMQSLTWAGVILFGSSSLDAGCFNRRLPAAPVDRPEDEGYMRVEVRSTFERACSYSLGTMERGLSGARRIDHGIC